MKLFLQKTSKFMVIFLILINLKVFLSIQNDAPLSNSKQGIYKRLTDESFNHINESLSAISNKQTHLYLTIDHLIYLSENEIISPSQSKLIWEFLTSREGKPNETNSIKPEKTQKTIEKNNKKNSANRTAEQRNSSSMSLVEAILMEAKTKMNFNQIMMLIILGNLGFGFFIFILSLALYRTERHGLLATFLTMVTLSQLSLALNLQIQLNCSFMPGVLVNLSFILFNANVHVWIVKLNGQKRISKLKEIFVCDNSFRGKILQWTLSSIFFYGSMFIFNSQLAQIPFYVSVYALVYMISQKYEPKVTKFCWPSWIFSFSCCSFLTIAYFYGMGKKNFVITDLKNIIKTILQNETGETMIDENEVDFQYFGFLISCIILNFIFPIYLYFQQHKVWGTYKNKDFNFYSMYKAIKAELNQEKLNLDFNYVYHHVYALVVFALIYIGLKIKICFMVLVSSYSLQSYLCFIIKDNNLFWRILFFIGSFYISNSIYLIGKMEDPFSNTVSYF